MNALLFSAASERNKAPILDVLRDVVSGCRNVLEIGSGNNVLAFRLCSLVRQVYGVDIMAAPAQEAT